MRPGKREFDHRSQPQAPSFRKKPRHHSAYHRQQERGPPINNFIASSSLASSSAGNSGPRLSDFRNQRVLTGQWQWDKAPSGVRSLSVRALKLFGVAHPNSELSVENLPDELKNMAEAKPLVPENSWIFRKSGDTIYPTIEEAVKAGGERPHNLPSFDGTLVNNKTILTKSVSGLEDAEQRYGRIVRIEKFADGTYAVQPQTAVEPKEGDTLLLPRTPNCAPVIEVLNCVPMRNPDAADIVPAIEDLCKQHGAQVKRCWKKLGSTACPYNLTRVFIELADPQNLTAVAQHLGETKFQGRELVVSLNYSPELQ